MFLFEWGYWQTVIRSETDEPRNKLPNDIDITDIPAYESDEIASLAAASVLQH